jgi:hypothetical protein
MLQSSDGKMSADAIEILGMSIHELRSLARRLHILDYQYLEPIRKVRGSLINSYVDVKVVG